MVFLINVICDSDYIWYIIKIICFRIINRVYEFWVIIIVCKFVSFFIINNFVYYLDVSWSINVYCIKIIFFFVIVFCEFVLNYIFRNKNSKIRVFYMIIIFYIFNIFYKVW